jgi:uncharacterized protein
VITVTIPKKPEAQPKKIAVKSLDRLTPMLESLIEALSDAAAFPHDVEHVEVRHTHISVVFLAGPYVYKVKKPVNLGSLDFTTLEKRRHFCDEEVRLNLRLAPSVYLGVVPITKMGTKWNVEGNGETAEWAVKMQRLPQEATFENRLQRGEIGIPPFVALAQKLASFHAQAEGDSHISEFGRFDVVASNARENFEQAISQVGLALSQAVFDRLRARTEDVLAELRPLIEDRARRGAPRDTHGDLHLDHVYWFPDRNPPADYIIIDCIEFNERFRYADPVADMAFLAMDLAFHGRRDLARAFADGYFRAARDDEGRTLLPFYTAYRAAVRAKVEGIELVEKEIPEAERTAALTRARAHWLLALGELEPPGRKPCLLLVGGLPGTGKSTLSRGLAEKCNFTVIRSDVVRKQLAGLAAHEPARAPFAKDIYSEAWTERTYAECLRRAEALLFEGRRVLIDASFRQESKRLAFLEAAVPLGVPGILMVCKAEPQIVYARLDSRRGDASDADRSIYEKAAQEWEEMGAISRRALLEVPCGGTQDESLAFSQRLLRDSGLFD